jgi:hypothetical protein
MHRSAGLLGSMLLGLAATTAQAATLNYEYSFSFSTLLPQTDAVPISGSFSFNYDPVLAPKGVQAIESISLTLAGFTFTTANALLEVTTGSQDRTLLRLYGTANGTQVLSSFFPGGGVPDFVFSVFGPDVLAGDIFQSTYSSFTQSCRFGITYAGAGRSFLNEACDGPITLTVTDPATAGPGGPVVPVPAAGWLLGSGLLGLAGIARRRARRA